ncbi:MAG: acyl-ACP--UDP-N-acetylglucosamine O-acyltransferase [Planctomycetota bacterium]|nr:acyl-ACP--UDP-N-acetylglucosamine O-acyltransferase [Planctomycetota bacterium]
MIHPSANIDSAAEIAPDVEIGPGVYIGPQVSIGSGCVLHHNSSVICNTRIGERNVIHPGAVLGGDPQDKKWDGEETWAEIGSDNLFREHCTVNRGTIQGGGVTKIGDACLILASSHIAHDCIVGNRVIMANGVLLGGHVVVEDQVGFGGLAAVHHYSTVGRLAFVGGMTRVTTDIPPYLITEGNPSRVRAINSVGMKRAGISEEVCAWLKEAQRLLYNNNMIRREAFELLERRGDVPDEGIHLRTFLRATEEGRQGRARQP